MFLSESGSAGSRASARLGDGLIVTRMVEGLAAVLLLPPVHLPGSRSKTVRRSSASVSRTAMAAFRRLADAPSAAATQGACASSGRRMTRASVSSLAPSFSQATRVASAGSAAPASPDGTPSVSPAGRRPGRGCGQTRVTGAEVLDGLPAGRKPRVSPLHRVGMRQVGRKHDRRGERGAGGGFRHFRDSSCPRHRNLCRAAATASAHARSPACSPGADATRAGSGAVVFGSGRPDGAGRIGGSRGKREGGSVGATGEKVGRSTIHRRRGDDR